MTLRYWMLIDLEKGVLGKEIRDKLRDLTASQEHGYCYVSSAGYPWEHRECMSCPVLSRPK